MEVMASEAAYWATESSLLSQGSHAIGVRLLGHGSEAVRPWSQAVEVWGDVVCPIKSWRPSMLYIITNYYILYYYGGFR